MQEELLHDIYLINMHWFYIYIFRIRLCVRLVVFCVC